MSTDSPTYCSAPNGGGTPPADSGTAVVGRMAAGTTVVLAGKVGGRGLQLLNQVLMARLLGAHVFGLFAIAWNLATIISQFAPAGLHNGVLRFGAQFWRKDDRAFSGVVVRAIGLGVIFSLCLSGAMFLSAPWLAVRLFEEPSLASAVRWFALLIPFATTLQIAVAVTRISQRMRFSVIAEEIVRSVLNVALFLLLFMLGFRLYGAVIACIASFAGAAGLAMYYVRKLYPELTFRHAWSERTVATGTLLGFSLATAVSGVSGSIVIRADRLFLGAFRAASEVGIYQSACQLPLIISVVLGGMNTAFAPAIAACSQHHQRRDMAELFRVATKWRFFLVLPMGVVMLLMPGELLSTIFGGEFTVARAALTILVLGQLINAGTGASGAVLMMSGLQNTWLAMTLGTVLLSSVLHCLFIPRLGMTGAALATFIATNSLYFCALAVVWCRLRIHPYSWNYLKGLAAAGAAAGVALLLKALVPWPPILLVCAVVVAVSIVFVLVLLACGLDAEDRIFLRMLGNRLSGRTRKRVT
jgi:O-antigen/teichoic acid export membrane protein